MKIAIFDSGIGGINVLKQAVKSIPEANYLYYADNLHVPYGTKPKAEVKGYILATVKFLAQQNIDALVIACNTATSISAADLRKIYSFPIIGMEPALKPAVKKYQHTHKRILVTATPLTLQEEKFQQLIDKTAAHHIADSLPLPELITFAENLEFSSAVIKPYLAKKLADYDLTKYSALVLGCTHFLFYKTMFHELLPENIEIFDGCKATVKQLQNRLNITKPQNNSGQKSQVEFIFSGKEIKYIKSLYPT
ncbi:MAG: glutamate racemase [Gammaproteobacteria bacterium]|nr:glutamate racemase [Gammaproteobacteria bacterium]